MFFSLLKKFASAEQLKSIFQFDMKKKRLNAKKRRKKDEMDVDKVDGNSSAQHKGICESTQLQWLAKDANKGSELEEGEVAEDERMQIDSVASCAASQLVEQEVEAIKAAQMFDSTNSVQSNEFVSLDFD